MKAILQEFSSDSDGGEKFYAYLKDRKGLESLLKEYGKHAPKEPDYNSKEYRLAMAEEILFGENKVEVFTGGCVAEWLPCSRRNAFSYLFDGGFVRIKP